MERTSSDDLDGQGYEEERAVFSSAAPSGDTFTSQPERDLNTEDPNFVGGAPPEPKKKMADKVKGIFKGHRHHDEDDDTDSAVGSGVGHTAEASPYGTAAAGNESTRHTLDSPAPGNEESVPHPQGETEGAALTDEQGNLKPGPHTDSVKRETVFTKIKDKLHGSK